MPLEVLRLSNNIKFVILKIVVVFVNFICHLMWIIQHPDSNGLAVFKKYYCVTFISVLLSIYYILETDLYLIKVIMYLYIQLHLMLCLSIDFGATEKPKIGPLFKPAHETPCWCIYGPRSFCKGHDFWDLDKDKQQIKFFDHMISQRSALLSISSLAC